MSGDTDRDLVDELRRGDAAALRSAYLLFQPRIFSYLVRLSGRREAAQDLSSEVWCRAMAKLHTLHPESRLLPWLFTIARNLYFSHCRWRNRDEHHLTELGLALVRRDPPPTPPETVIRSEQEAALEEALGRLPRIYREAVMLVGIEGLSHEEAAQVSGILADAFRQRFSRGMRMLKENLASEGGSPDGGGER